jgi:hypothetical protein
MAGDWSLNSITDSLGSVLGIGGGVVPSKDSSSTTGLWGPLLQGGLGLAGIYFQQKGAKSMAEEAARQRMAEIEAAKAKGGGGGGGSGLALKLAKMNNLAQLYDSMAKLQAQGGQAIMQGANQTANNAIEPILARLGKM